MQQSNELVSIPQGTIKRGWHKITTVIPNRFQFHKVRLKARHRCFIREIDVVSIPQGTIKRRHRCFIREIDVVSIPQGTIKRSARNNFYKKNKRFQFHKVRLKAYERRANQTSRVMFQFHKVRLKVTHPIARDTLFVVSIPQGTIKRTAKHAQAFLLLLFQFHKVRLKGVSTLMHHALTRLFQFHKVRLKVR